MTPRVITPPLRWFGSKVRLAPRLVSMLPTHEHYVEVFAGSAAVLFNKPPSYLETINDLDGDVINLFRVLRDPDLAERLAYAVALTPYARGEFVAARAARTGTPPDDPVERARLLIVCAQQAVGGHRQGWSYNANTRATSTPRINRWAHLPARLERAATRLRAVQIECADWRVMFDRYDAPGVCLFVDPPYHHDTRPNTTDGYVHEMTGTDHDELVDRLIALEHATALVTHYPHPTYDQLTAAGWHPHDLDAYADNPAARRQMARTERVWTSPGAVSQMALGLS